MDKWATSIAERRLHAPPLGTQPERLMALQDLGDLAPRDNGTNDLHLTPIVIHANSLARETGRKQVV